MTPKRTLSPSLFDLFGKDAVRRVRALGVLSSRNLRRRGGMKWDLGARTLLPEWKAFFSKQYLREDVIAGLTVACVAIPLSLAIALASGVEPAVGLVTAIVAGIVCAFFGGTRLAVSGPAAAMAVLIATQVDKHGMGGLLVIGLVVGILQLTSGILGLGGLARFVPVPVISGFTAGIGAIILIGQLPRALGLPPPDQAHVFDVITHLGELIHETRPLAVLLTILTMIITMGLPKIAPRFPAPLIAVTVSTVLVWLFDMKVQLVGSIPNTLPLPTLPSLPTSGWAPLMASAFIVYCVATLETLLSCSATDKLGDGQKHEPNQELIGQGLGNVAVAMFGGIPVTAVIARSALNLRSGAKTRRSAIIHSFAIMAAVFLFANVIGHIPVAALAGILLSIALVMLHPKELQQLWLASRTEAAVYAITFLSIVFIDLLAGVQVGFVAAAVIALFRVGHTQVFSQLSGKGTPYRLSISGALSFLSSAKIDSMRQSLEGFDPSRGVVIDMTRVTTMDTTGAEQFTEFLAELRAGGANLVLKGLPPQVESLLKLTDSSGTLQECFALTESDVYQRLRHNGSGDIKSRLVFGVEQFRHEVRPQYAPLFERLAGGQAPHTLFITCSDSRINPNLLTSTEPGELFIVRNAGNLVPAFGTDDIIPVEGATIEFAIGVLGVRDVVVCGHSACGAMKACVGGDPIPSDLPSLARFVEYLRKVNEDLPQGITPDEAAKHNVRRQIDHLRSYPIVRRRLREKSLQLFGWFYDVSHGEFLEWDEQKSEFVKLRARINAPPAIEAGKA